MGKPFWRSVEYFFTGNYSADDGNNTITAIGAGGVIHAYGGDDHIKLGSLGATVYTGEGNDTVDGGALYLRIDDTGGNLKVHGAAGYADINKSGDGNVTFNGAAGGVDIEHTGGQGRVDYAGAAAYNRLVRKGESGGMSFSGAGGYNSLWHETNDGDLSFSGAGAGNKIDRTWFDKYQGSHGNVSFYGAGAANSISSRVETGNIFFAGAGVDNHIVRRGKAGDITMRGAGASNRIERTRNANDVYTETRGDIDFEGAGGYNSLYSDVAHGNIHFSGAGAYNTITRKGAGNDFSSEGLDTAKAENIALTTATMSGSWIGYNESVTGIKSTTEPNTYLFAFADGTYTKINKVQLSNDPQTGKLKYYSTAWYKEGNHLENLAEQDISSNSGFTAVNQNGAYTLSDLTFEHQQSITVHAVEADLTEDQWIAYGNNGDSEGGVQIDAADVTLSDAKMEGRYITGDGTKMDVSAIKSNLKPNTYVYSTMFLNHTRIVVVELANDPETGVLKYQAKAWYKRGDHTADLANEDISRENGYISLGVGDFSLSEVQYSVNAVRSTSEHVEQMQEYSEQALVKSATADGESSGDVRFEGAGGGNVINSNVTRGNVYFNGGGIANVIQHSSKFGDTEFIGGGAANVIVKSGEQGDLTFRGAGLANVLVHQSQQGKMDVNAGGAANVLVRVGDGEYLAHLLAIGNISVHKGNGDSQVTMLGGFNTHTQVGNGNATWMAAGGFNVMTQMGKGEVASVLAGGANVLSKIGGGDLIAGMLGGANIITHISGDNESSDTTAVALGGANILTKKGKGDALAVMGGGANVLTHVGDGATTGVMVGGANVLTKVGNGDTTGVMLGIGNVLTHVGDGQTLGVMGAAGNIFTKVGDGTSIAAMVGAGNIFTHVGEGDAWALMGGLGNVFTKVGNGNALALMVAEANVFTHIGDGMSVALMLAKGNVATKVGNGTALAAMVGNANIFTHVGDGSTFAAMIGQANIMTKVGDELTAALMVGKANIMTHVGDGTSIGMFAGEANIMTKVGDGTTLAAMFGKANIMTHVGDGLTGVLALGEANIVTKVGDDFMGVVAAAKANVVTHVGDATTAAVLAGKGNILTKVGEGTTVGLLISEVGNVMTHVGDGATIGFAKGKANIITKVGDGLGINAGWGNANVFTHVGDGDRYNFAKGEANVITKVGDGQEVSVVQGKANIVTHVGNGDDYTGAWGQANVITKVGDGRNVVLAKGDANIVTQVGNGDSFNALWSKGNIVTKVGDGMQVTAAKGQANITTTVGNGLSVTAAYGDANINTKVGDGISVNVAWGKFNVNTKVGDGLNVAVMKGKANANIHVGDGLGINASYAQNNVAIKIGNGDFYSLAVASSNTDSNKLSALFDNIKQTVLGVGGSQAINYLVQGDEATVSDSGAIDLAEVSSIDGFQMDEIDEVSTDLGGSLSSSVTAVETPDLEQMQSALSVKDAQGVTSGAGKDTTSAVESEVTSDADSPNLITNGDFSLGGQGWQSTNGIEADFWASAYGIETNGQDSRVSELATAQNTTIYQDLQDLVEGSVISLNFDFAKRQGISADNGIEVIWNGEVVFSSSDDESVWQQKSLELMAQAGTNRIEFKGTGENDGLGYVLDNVAAKVEKLPQELAVSDTDSDKPNLITNGNFEQGGQGWQSTHGIEAYASATSYGVEREGHGDHVSELATDQNTTLYQDIQNLADGEVISLSFDFAKREGISADNGIEVIWNGNVVFSTSGDESAWQQKTLQLTAKAGSNRIEFKGTGHNDGLGYILDNVVAKSEMPQHANAVSEHAEQNEAAQNAMGDKERAEADRQRLEQEKEKQLAALSGSQSQLESTDQQALENNGHAQRDAVKDEADAVTAELTAMAQGLDALNEHKGYEGESGDSWREHFAGGVLDGVQGQLDNTKDVSDEYLSKVLTAIAESQKNVKEAVANSEAGVAKGEQSRAGAEQDIAEAKADAESRKAEALSQQDRAEQAERDAHSASDDAQSRGERDSAAAENKASQAQADAKGAKLSEGDRPEREGAAGSGLAGNAYDVQGAGETASHVDAEVMVDEESQAEADGRFSEDLTEDGLTEEEQEALEAAQEAVNQLQINAGVRSRDSGATVSSMFTQAHANSIVVPNASGADALGRKSQQISGVNLEGLGDVADASGAVMKAVDGFDFSLLGADDASFIDSTKRHLGKLSTDLPSKELKAVRRGLHYAQQMPSEDNLAALEMTLQKWQKKRPNEFAQRSELVKPLKFEIASLQSHIQASRAKDADVFGIAIDPKAAEAFESKVVFDGIGRVAGLVEPLAADEISRLQSLEVVSPTQTNSTSEREAAKTENESIVEFVYKLSQVDAVEADASEISQLAEQAKALWMNGNVTQESAVALFSEAHDKLTTHPELQTLAGKLLSDAQKEKATGQYLDNLFGRRFDSEIAHELVKTPTEQAINTSVQIGTNLVNDFDEWMHTLLPDAADDALRDERIQKKMEAFAKAINKDARPWFSRVPTLTQFLETPNYDNFKTMMTQVDDGFGVIKVPFLAVKMAITPGLGMEMAPWKAEGDRFYQNVITKARSTSAVISTGVDGENQVNLIEKKTSDYGTALHYQPKGDAYEDFQEGRSVADGRILTPGKETTFESNALNNGLSVVTGASGSTNIMMHLNQHLASKNPGFSVDQAYLNTLSFLVFDGGHSVNESLAVYKALQETGDDRKAVLESYTANYQDLVELVGDDSKDAVRTALDNAFEKTLEFYKEHAHSASEELEALGGKRQHQRELMNESVAIDNDGTPPRDKSALSPLTRFLNDELYGSKEDRRNTGEITQALLDHAVAKGESDKVTLKGDSGRLTGYFHHGKTTQAGEQDSDVSQKVVLFLHGSGSSAEEQASAIRNHYQKQGMDMLAVNMRGYGESDGGPSEKGLYQDARTMFSYLVNDKGIDPSNIIIHGYSMGGPIAADLARYAAQNGKAVSGLLLDRPMPSMTKAITGHEVPNPAGIVGALSKAVNGQFSVEKNLKGLPKETPIMLLTDNEGLGTEGEKMRAKLTVAGYNVTGEQTFYAHEASNRLMSQYAGQIVSRFSGSPDAQPDVMKGGLLQNIGDKIFDLKAGGKELEMSSFHFSQGADLLDQLTTLIPEVGNVLITDGNDAQSKDFLEGVCFALSARYMMEERVHGLGGGKAYMEWLKDTVQAYNDNTASKKADIGSVEQKLLNQYRRQNLGMAVKDLLSMQYSQLMDTSTPAARDAANKEYGGKLKANGLTGPNINDALTCGADGYESVMDKLRNVKKSTYMTFMSQGHAMSVVVHKKGNQKVWSFYDPNFGTKSFAQYDDFRGFMDNFHKGLLTQYKFQESEEAEQSFYVQFNKFEEGEISGYDGLWKDAREGEQSYVLRALKEQGKTFSLGKHITGKVADFHDGVISLEVTTKKGRKVLVDVTADNISQAANLVQSNIGQVLADPSASKLSLQGSAESGLSATVTVLEQSGQEVATDVAEGARTPGQEEALAGTGSKANNQDVESWEHVAVTPKADGGETRFDGQVIIQTENDPAAAKAAANLAAKHPESSVVVQLDADGNYRVVYGEPSQLSGKLRWQLVGHGRDESENNNTRLSGYSATELAAKLAQFNQDFSQAENITSQPEHISIVGCSLVSNDKQEGFARRFVTAMDEQGIRSDVSARSTEVAVDSTGRKHTRDTNDQWGHNLTDNKVVLSWNEQGEVIARDEAVRNGIAEGDIELARVGQSDSDAPARGAIADNGDVFTAPEKRQNTQDAVSSGSDSKLSYSGNIQLVVGDGEFTAVNWGTSNVGIKVGNGGFKSLAFGDNNVMVHVGNGDSKHSFDMAGYQALEGAQMFIGNRNVSFNMGRSNDLIVMADKSIPTPPMVNPFDGASRISGVLQGIARSGEGQDWLTAQEQQWTLSGAEKFVKDMSGLDQTSSVDYTTLVELDSQNERSSRGLKSDAEATLNKQYNQWLSGNGDNDTSKMSRADKFRQANEKLAFNFAVGGQGADIQVTTGNWNFMFGDNIQSILDTNLGSLFGLMTQQFSSTGQAKTTFTYNPEDLPRQLKNKLLGKLASVGADTTLGDIFGVDYSAGGHIVSRNGEAVDGVAILTEMLEVIGEFSGDQLQSFVDPSKLLDSLESSIDMGAEGIKSFAETHGLKEKAPEGEEEMSSVSVNGETVEAAAPERSAVESEADSTEQDRAFGFNALNLPNLFATIFSKDKQDEMASLVTNLKENLTADLLNMKEQTFDFLRSSGHLQGDGDINVSLGNYNFNWGGDGKDLGAYLGDNNNFWGGRGDDVYYATGTSNIFTGGEGNDMGVLMGRENMMFGGDGNDTAVVAGRINHVFMGAGNDQSFVFGEGGEINSGTGQDYVVTSGNFNRVDAGEDQDYSVTIGNNNQVELGGGNDFANVFGNYNRINGSAGNDVIKLMGYHAVLNGGEGDDHLIAAAISKFSQFDGGEGRDLMVLGGYQNTFRGGDDVDSFIVSGDVIDNLVEDIRSEDNIVFNGVNWQNLWFERSGYDLTLSVLRDGSTDTDQDLFESVGAVTFADYFNGNRAELVIGMGDKDVSGEREYTALSDNAVDALVQAMSSFAPTAGDNGFIDNLDSKARVAVTTAWADVTNGKGAIA